MNQSLRPSVSSSMPGRDSVSFNRGPPCNWLWRPITEVLLSRGVLRSDFTTDRESNPWEHAPKLSAQAIAYRRHKAFDGCLETLKLSARLNTVSETIVTSWQLVGRGLDSQSAARRPCAGVSLPFRIFLITELGLGTLVSPITRSAPSAVRPCASPTLSDLIPLAGDHDSLASSVAPRAMQRDV